MKVFGYNERAVEELTSQKKKQGWLTILGELSFLLILYLFKPFDTNQESTTNFIVIFLFLGVSTFFLGTFLYEAGRINQVILNVQKNKVTLINDGLQIVYTPDFTKPGAENFAEILFTDIKNVELIIQNSKNLEYCNFAIFTSTNMYKLCIENPALVRRSILDIIDNKCTLVQGEGVESRHKWLCKCGKMISSAVCPFCGENYETKTLTADGLKIYIENELKKQQKGAKVLGFFEMYLECIYGNMSEEICIENIRKIINECSDFIDKEYVSIMLSACNEKLNSMHYWRCMGCDRILSVDIQECDCGYKQSLDCKNKEAQDRKL